MHFSFILCTNRLITWCRRIRTNPPKKTCFLDLLDILKEKKKKKRNVCMVLKIEMVKEPKLDKVPDFSLIFSQIWRFLPNQIRD